MKIEHFKISIFLNNFRNFEIFDFHWLFQRFFRKMFDLEKYFSIFFDKMFRRIFFRWKFFCLPISIPKFPKIPKIALRKLCDEPRTDFPSSYFYFPYLERGDPWPGEILWVGMLFTSGYAIQQIAPKSSSEIGLRGYAILELHN